MADVHTKEQRSYNMSQIKSKNTKPEVVLRKKIFAGGLRGYRINYKLPGKPDIVFTKHKVAVFVDGCFWHKCPKCFVQPTTNKKFWNEKIKGNVQRDKKVNQLLAKSGYITLRFWEHEIKSNLNNNYILIKNTLLKKEVEYGDSSIT